MHTYTNIAVVLIVTSIRRSHTPDIGLVMPAKVPEIPSHRKHSPPTVPKHGSPLASRRQLAVDSSTPPSLPPKKGHSVEYVEVSVSH